MKNMRKAKTIVSFLLALVLTLAMTVTAFAEGPSDPSDSYRIQIRNENVGHTYEAYQIFKGRLETVDKESVLSDMEWGSGVDSAKLIAALKEKYFLPEDPGMADVAKALENIADKSEEAKELADIVGACLTNEVKATATAPEDGVYTLGGLEAGYYFVKDKDTTQDKRPDAYTDFILSVTQNTAVEAKSSYPTVTKKVQTGADTWGDASDYGTSETETIKFQLTGKMPSTLEDYTTYQYVFHDKLSQGLKLKADSFEVKIDGIVLNKGAYTLNTTTPADGNTFELSFTDVLDKEVLGVEVTAVSTIVVTYEAYLKGDGVVYGNPGNPNEVYLTYSNNPNGEGTGKSAIDKAFVFTYGLTGTKVDGNAPATPLSGAEFKLAREDKWAILDANKRITGWADAEAGGTAIVSGTDGVFTVKGLDAGTYTLKETKAPVGYNIPDETTLIITAAIEVPNGKTDPEVTTLTIKEGDQGQAANGVPDTGIVSIQVKNYKGAVLPSTGGIGTTIFYVLGGILVAVSGVLLITRRRMSRR